MSVYTGKVLWVNLSSGQFAEEQIPQTMYQKYLGGSGLGAALLYREIPDLADPLGPDNILGFFPGLLTGSTSLFTGRWMAVGKSPLTGTWGEANCGGNLAFAIKQCGYDGILFRGISPHPVYFSLDSRGPRLLNAVHLWGLDAVDTEKRLIQSHQGKKKPAVATIGQAGENLSLISGIVNDQGRLAARSGLGAVMGSKKLKAVVLEGSQAVQAHNPAKMRLLSLQCTKNISLPLKLVNSKILSRLGALVGRLPVGLTQSGLMYGSILAKWGTIGTFSALIGMGDTPIKNWTGSRQDTGTILEKIDPDLVLKSEKRKYHCRGCPLGCGGIVQLTGTAQESHKPEYETTVSFTAMLLADDLGLVYTLNDQLNRAGMDSISAGAVIAFAMECYEKGWITREDTGGLELTWGNTDSICTLVRQMINREGFGAQLADGVRIASDRFGPQTKQAAVHAGGQEPAFHDPRLDPGLALHASVDPTPGRHTTGAQQFYDMYKLWTRVPSLPPSYLIYPKSTRYQPGNRRTEAAVAMSNFTQFYNSAGACYMGMMIGVDRVPIFEWANAATGWDYTPADYLHAGQRIQTLRQMFNIRQGIDPWSLKINPRVTGHPPLDAGPNKGIAFDLEPLMEAYWLEIGWDPKTGIPTQATLDLLDIGWDPKTIIPTQVTHDMLKSGDALNLVD